MCRLNEEAYKDSRIVRCKYVNVYLLAVSRLFSQIVSNWAVSVMSRYLVSVFCLNPTSCPLYKPVTTEDGGMLWEGSKPLQV